MYYNNRDVRLQEHPRPRAGRGELLVKVMASGICGSDVMEWYRLPKAPLVLGHEVTGEIVEVGEGVGSFRLGQKVFVSHHVPCMVCRHCLAGHHSVCETLSRTNFDPGGLAEYVRVPAINVAHGTFILPPEISYEEGVFIEPLACVIRGQRMAGLRPGQTVLVLGSGMAGLLHVQLACASGAGKVMATDLSPYRMEAARRLGANAVFRGSDDVPGRVREANGGRLADLVVTATGAPRALEQAFRSVEPGGTILFFAPTDPGASITIPFNDLWRNEVTMTSSYAGSPAEILQAIELIGAGRVRVGEMITHRLGLEAAGKGFMLVAEAQDSIKVIIEPHGPPGA
jgi:L-iditol 2-dehydrogenase